MHAHGVEILDGAHHDDVVAAVTHELELILLPSDDGFLQQDLVRGARLQAGPGDAQQIGFVVGDAGSCPAHGEGGAHDDRVSERDDRGQAVVNAVADRRACTLSTHIRHDPAEELAVFTAFDGVHIGADELDAVAFEGTRAVQGHGRVEGGLATKGREEGIGPLTLDDALDVGGRDGLDIGRIGDLRVGHDRRRVGVDEDDADALGLEHAARLGAGVVELARLADHDRARSDDEDRVDVLAPRHERAPTSTRRRCRRGPRHRVGPLPLRGGTAR